MPVPPADPGFLCERRVMVDLPGQVLMHARYRPEMFSTHLFEYTGTGVPDFLSRAVPKRQADYLSGRLLAAEALQKLGIAPAPIGRGAYGEPLWPNGVRGSITHSHGAVAVWLTTQDWHPGLDIEFVPGASALDAIRAVVLTEAEREMKLDNQALTAVFSAKEAFFKGLFPMVGSCFGFAAAEMLDCPTAHSLRLRLTRDLTDDLTAGRHFDISLDWVDDRIMSRFAGK